jgi:hypothetical protein
MRSFISSLVASSVLFMGEMVNAQTTHECLVVGRMRGDQSESNPLISDMPLLLAAYWPDMSFNGLTVHTSGYQKDKNGIK